MLAGFIGGAVVTEAVFTYPGLGRLVIQAISSRDYPLIQGSILVILAHLHPDQPHRRRALRLHRPEDRLWLIATAPPVLPWRRLCSISPGRSRSSPGRRAGSAGPWRRRSPAPGAHVVLNGRDRDGPGRAGASSCRRAGQSAEIIALRRRGMPRPRRRPSTSIAARHGRLDILVSNAATTVRKPVAGADRRRLGPGSSRPTSPAASAWRGRPAASWPRPAMGGSSSRRRSTA